MWDSWPVTEIQQDLTNEAAKLQIDSGEQQQLPPVKELNNRRKFRSQTSDNIGQMEKAEVGRVREEKSRREKIREEKESEKKEDAGARKGSKVAKQCVFPMICGSGGSKSRLAKAAGAEPCGQMRVEKLHAVVVRSTFPSQNVQNTPCLGHFWKLRCRKSARRCGAKHISKSKCTKHTNVGPLLEVEMSKKCTPLWAAKHISKRHYTTLHTTVRNTFAQLRFATLHTKSAHVHTATAHTTHCTLHTTHYTPQHTTLRYTTLHKLHELHKLQLQLKRQLQLQLQPHYITLHYANYTKLRSTPLHYATLNYITLRYNYNYNYNYKNSCSYTTLHYTALH